MVLLLNAEKGLYVRRLIVNSGLGDENLLIYISSAIFEERKLLPGFFNQIKIDFRCE